MAIKGMSEDVVAAFEFDPFAAMNEGGQGSKPSGQSPSGRSASSPPAQRGQQPAAGAPESGAKPDSRTSTQQASRAATPGVPPSRDPTTGRWTSGQQPAAPAGRQPTQAAPAPEEGGNSVEELMNRLRESPAMFLAPSGPAAPEMGAPPPQQAPGGGAPDQVRWGYDYSRPWGEQRVDLPPQLLEAIFHEDRNVAAQGMSVLVNTMYNSIMNDIHTRVAEVLRNTPVMTSAVADMTSARQALKTKFYGKFQDLADPVGMQTVYTLAMNVANLYNQMGQQVDPMSDDFIEYVGNQALQMLGRARTQPQPRRQFATGGATREVNGQGNPFMEAIGMA